MNTETEITDKELSRAIFDKDGILYPYDYKTLIKCSNTLQNVVLHPNTRIIANYAFAGCKIKTISLHSRLRLIGHYAFHYSLLASISIPESVEFIGNNAFRTCEQLSNVVLPTNIEELQENTFLKCTSLRNISIPKSVTKIGGGCFSGCFNLNIEFENHDTFIVWRNCLFDKIAKSLISCWSTDDKIYLPPNTLRIENNAFMACKHFDIVEIPSKVVYIGKNIIGSSGVTSLYLPNSIKEMDSFALNKHVKHLYIPKGIIGKYKHLLYSSYHKIIEEI